MGDRLYYPDSDPKHPQPAPLPSDHDEEMERKRKAILNAVGHIVTGELKAPNLEHGAMDNFGEKNVR